MFAFSYSAKIVNGQFDIEQKSEIVTIKELVK